jgi:hypothetical protein
MPKRVAKVLGKAGPGTTFAAGRERSSDADLQGLLDGWQRLLDAEDTEAASGLAEVICARLRAQGDIARAAALGQATLEAMPSPSACAARWLAVTTPGRRTSSCARCRCSPRWATRPK